MNKNFITNKRKVATKNLILFSATFLIFILSSCATTMTQSQVVSSDYVPITDSGYIYGRFTLLAANEGYSIGLVLQNIDNLQKYNFVLDTRPKNVVQLIAVPQGNYRVDSIEYIKPKNKVAVTLDFSLPPEQYQRNFVVELNTAIYIGDYSGIAKGSLETKEVLWSLQIPTDGYDETTIGIQEKYPFLKEADISFVSNMKTP